MNFTLDSHVANILKTALFCNCASLWPMWYIHRLRVNIYTHPRKNKMVKKKKKKKLAQT